MAQNFVYVGCRTTKERDARGKGIATYEIDTETGVWRYLDTCPAGHNPSYLLASKKYRRLYAIHGDGTSVSSFVLNPLTGLPEQQDVIACHGKNPVHLCFDRDERHLLIANYASGNVANIALDDNGRFINSSVLLTLPPLAGPHNVEQRGPHPHFIGRIKNHRFDTDWYAIPDKGSDRLYVMHYSDNVVKETVFGKSRDGSAPRHAVMHPSRPYIFVANELDSTLTAWSFDMESKQLTPIHTISVIPPQYHKFAKASGIAITADGSMIYISNRGHNSIALIKLDEIMGLPVSITWESTQGDFPRFISLSEDEKFLYVTNERTDNIVQFRVNDNKTLRPTGQIIETGSPVSLAFY